MTTVGRLWLCAWSYQIAYTHGITKRHLEVNLQLNHNHGYPEVTACFIWNQNWRKQNKNFKEHKSWICLFYNSMLLSFKLDDVGWCFFRFQLFCISPQDGTSRAPETVGNLGCEQLWKALQAEEPSKEEEARTVQRSVFVLRSHCW